MSANNDQRNNVISLPTLRVVGLMSGTSLDGCDTVLVEISPKGRSVRIKTIDFITYPMPFELRSKILKQLQPEQSRIDELTQLDAALGIWFVEAVESLLEHAGIRKEEIDLIGSHGQTMWHDVQPRTAENQHMERMTWQLGDGSFLSARTGITTICDFRTADVALGGQGAPLMPVFDHLVYGDERKKTIALQNIGGIGNVTVLPETNSNAPPTKIMGFDTGPGNMIIDRFAELITEGKEFYDEDGRLAAQGNVVEDLLEYWMQHPFFQQLPPKSTGREQFGHAYADECWKDAVQRGVSPVDAIATATALTAKTIAHSYQQAQSIINVYPDEVIVAGGGARNTTLMNILASYVLPTTKVVRAGDRHNFNDRNSNPYLHNTTTNTNHGNCTVDDNSEATDMDTFIEADSKEAVAFAVFAYQAFCGRGNHLPSTTGASHNIILGKICPGDNFRQLLIQPLPRHYQTTSSFTTKTRSLSTARESRSILPVTETRHFASQSLDQLPAVDILQLLNNEDVHVTQVVASLQAQIADTATKMAQAIASGGRVFYVGAGTSGRLGVLDASEIPPTFSAPPHWFQGIIAGGDVALRSAVEGAEDNFAQGGSDLLSHNLTAQDIVIGIASSGTTPYVHGALSTAKQVQPGCYTVLLSCNPVLTQSNSENYIDTYLTAVVGPEILTGSTRLKAGTATKMILNQLSTIAMILSGKTYGNLMVDLRVSNEKLKRRAIRIIQIFAPDMSDQDVAKLLEKAGNKVKTALAMHLTNTDSMEDAEAMLLAHGGRLGNLIFRK